MEKLVAVNYAASASQARIAIPCEIVRADLVMLHDTLADALYPRAESGLTGSGLYVTLDPWQSHLFGVRED